MAGETQPMDTTRIDVCFKVAERARDRFKARQTFEWRYAFALWTLLAGGAAVIFTAGSFDLSLWLAALICVANLTAAGVIIWFYNAWLNHLDEECEKDRDRSIHYETEMMTIAGVTQFPEPRPEQPEGEQPTNKRPGHRVVQMHRWVVVVLAVFFVFSPGARYFVSLKPTEANVTVEQGSLKIEGGTTKIDLDELRRD